MNRTKIESFAKAARNMLQDQIKSRIEQIQSGSYSIATIERPEAVKQLNNAILKHELKNVVEEYAYTWFNRLCAIRFMDAHNYNQTMVITPKEGRSIPEILADALDGVIEECVGSQDRTRIAGLLSGDVPSDNAQSEVFRILLVSKCKSLSKDLPFLFESSYDDFSDILLPDDLLSSGSIIAKLLDALDDENCENVEVIGWLYQYYISERKDEIFADFKKGKKATATEIPAATQLFTPDWIVRYLVENSIGRLWVLNHPGSTLANKMKFYIKPAQRETEFVRIDNPEDFRICDPCCGSGHMLTYSFDILMEIYEEYGYSRQDAVVSIIRNNLYGIELDKRAGQLTYFALMMKAREKDRRFFSRKIEPNVCVLEAVQFSDEDVHSAMEMFEKPSLFIMDMLKQFEHADTFGSLIVPTITDIDGLKSSFDAKSEGYLFDHDLISRIEKVLRFSEFLSTRYNIVVTNPPYMNSSHMDVLCKSYLQKCYEDYKTDMFSAFVVRCTEMVINHGYLGFMTPYVWMFISSYEKLRLFITKKKWLSSLVQLEYSAFGDATVPLCIFTLKNGYEGKKGSFFRLTEFKGGMEVQSKKLLDAIRNVECDYYYEVDSTSFSKIPGNPIAYWTSEALKNSFGGNELMETFAPPKQGSTLGINDLFLRMWYEVCSEKRGTRWLPCVKGGDFRKWYGNHQYVIDWENDGKRVKATGRATIRNSDKLFLPGIHWSRITSSKSSFRELPEGFFFESAAGVCFPKRKDIQYTLGLLNSKIVGAIASAINPTLTLQSGDVACIPVKVGQRERVEELSLKNIRISQEDWDFFEISWDFKEHPLVGYSKALCDGTYVAAQIDHYYGKHMPVSCPLELCFLLWQGECNERFNQLKANEEELNRIFIDIYGLQDELTPEESDSDVTVRKADLKRDMQSFVSYAVGCMFGRYSLNYEGLAYAGGEWDESRYSTFKTDDDNVIPVLDDEWFSDDIVARFKEFVKVVFGSDTYDANLRYVEKALGRSLRDYFTKDFYQNHLKIYQKRPIYWMFSSPGGSFNALVYLHRYNRNTVDVVLKYLRDYKTKIRAQIAVLKGNNDAQSVRDLMKYEKIDKDLDEYEQILYSLALKHVDLNLDDGVKVNYGKLGNALYPVDGLNREKK